MSGNIYCLYRHTSPSGKAYIGITNDYTRRCTEHQRCDGSSPKFHRAIKKYGWDNFTHEILACDLTEAEAQELEIACIARWNTITEGYNSTRGGQTAPWDCTVGVAKTELHRQRIGDANRLRGHPLELKIKAYMARWNKTREEAEAYYEKKAADPLSTNKYADRGYYSYASVKKTRMKHRQGLIDDGTYRNPNERIGP